MPVCVIPFVLSAMAALCFGIWSRGKGTKINFSTPTQKQRKCYTVRDKDSISVMGPKLCVHFMIRQRKSAGKAWQSYQNRSMALFLKRVCGDKRLYIMYEMMGLI